MKKLSLTILTIALSYFGYSQVSYQSKVIRDTEYIPPVDLNLLREVNSYKQNNYQHYLNDINNKLSYLHKMLQYLPKTNWHVIVNEYNTIVRLKSNYDLSNPTYYNYFVNRISNLEKVVDWAMKNPDSELNSDFFTKHYNK